MAAIEYLSNLTPRSFEEQQTAIRGYLLTSGVDKTFRDELAKAQKRTPEKYLIDRRMMLRPSTRCTGDAIYVDSFANLARHEADFRETLKAIWQRHAHIVSVEDKTGWGPGEPIKREVEKIVALWRAARKKHSTIGAAIAGGNASGAKAKVRTSEGIKKIKHLWPLPSTQYSIKAIEKISGVSRGAIVAVLGNRGPAQLNYRAAQKRKAKREAKG